MSDYKTLKGVAQSGDYDGMVTSDGKVTGNVRAEESISGKLSGKLVNGEAADSGVVTGFLAASDSIKGVVTPDDVMSGDIMHTVLKGISAYQEAVNHGFVGTEEEWLASLGATVAVGNIESGGPISITNVGTPQHAIFDFVIPDAGAADIARLSQSAPVIFYCGTATEVV